MTKLLSKIIGGILGVTLATFAGVGIAFSMGNDYREAKAANTATLTFSAKCNGSGTDDESHSWSVTSDANESTYDSTKGIHYGTSSTAVSYLTITSNYSFNGVTSITVNASGASGTSAKLNTTVGGAAFGSQKSLTSSAANYGFTGSASGAIEVKLTQNSAKKALYVKSIAVTYESGSSGSEETFELVTSVTELAANQKVIIVSGKSSSSYALSTTQNTNNRGATAVTVSNYDTIAVSTSSAVEVFELGGNVTNGWSLHATKTAGYLYAGASDANQLKTQSTNDSNGLWKFTINPTSYAVTTDTFGSNRDTLRYNPNTSNNNPLFNCYDVSSTVGNLPYLFKLVDDSKEIVDQRVAGTLSASNMSSEWNVNGLKFEVKYDGETEYADVTSKSTFVVNDSIPTFTENTTAQISVTGTFTKGETTITATNNVTAVLTIVDGETSIERLYYENQGTLSGYFYGYYMGYCARARGTDTYYDIYVGNGDYAMLVYGTGFEPDYVPFETPLKISGGYLQVYNNLYEVTSRYSNRDYPITIVELEDEIEIARILPVSIYDFTGAENPSLFSSQKLASRLAAVSGTVKNVSGTIAQSGNGATVVIELDNGNNASVFVTSGSATLDYTKLSSSLVVNARVAVKGFVSIYQTNFQLVQPTVIDIPDPYNASLFAQDLLDATSPICSAAYDVNAKPLAKVWATLQTEKYVCLTVTDKTTLKNATADENGDVIAQAMARYDLICTKYGLTNFIGRTSANNASNFMRLFSNITDNGALSTLIFVSLIGFTTIGAFFFLRKRKEDK